MFAVFRKKNRKRTIGLKKWRGFIQVGSNIFIAVLSSFDVLNKQRIHPIDMSIVYRIENMVFHIWFKYIRFDITF